MNCLLRCVSILVFLSFYENGQPNICAQEMQVYPGKHWETKRPADVGLNEELLSRFAENVGGDGCIIRDGYLVKSWGEVTRHKDWASAAKPVLSTLLLLAVQENRIESVDSRVQELGWELSAKDSSMTYRHLANMLSGYALNEKPGEAWGYNDFAIQLYAQSLEKIFGDSLENVFRDRMRAIQLEDGEFFGSREGAGVTASSRDFARLGWLWLNHGKWNNAQLLDRRLFDACFRVGVPVGTPRAKNHTDDYLKIDSYGGGTNQTASGPGAYGFNLWFNSVLESGARVWPALPADTYQANGLWNRDTLTVIPSWRMVIASRGAEPGKFEPGIAQGQYNQNLQLIAQAVDDAVLLDPIDLSEFGSGIGHWRKLRDESRFIQVEKDQPAYAATQVREIVDNILLFQRANGGWPKDYDMTAILSPHQRRRVTATHEDADTSYDNDNIFSQVRYLARAVHQVEDPAWKAACERGFDFILRSQYANGGFPQRFPEPHSYHAHITFNDGVMIGALQVLKDAADHAEYFQWLDDARREQAKQAVERGISSILSCQIRVDGKLAGWCQQHDEVSFEARPARTFELASLCPQETTQIARFLMSQPRPSAKIQQAVDAAVAWLELVSLSGVRVKKIKSTPESFLRHDTDIDVIVVDDPTAEAVWARHYEIESNRPVFAGRDGVKKYALAQIERERRTGTPWYGSWPSELIEKEYPHWKRRLDDQ